MLTRLLQTVQGMRHGAAYAEPWRDAMLRIAKTVVATTIAWILAERVLRAPSAAFAPFSAMLMVQVTVYQSMAMGVRFGAAMVAGVLLAGLLSPLLGPGIATFAMVTLAALLLGQWRKLGSQGIQVAVAAMFGYAAFVEAGHVAGWRELASIAGLVLMGSLLGVLTNLLLFPPLHYRGARTGMHTLTWSIAELARDLVSGLRDAPPTHNQAEAWWDRTRRLPRIAAQTRHAVESAAESFRFNPRRLLTADTSTFEGHRIILTGTERAAEQLGAIARELTYAARTRHPCEPEHERFQHHLADVLDAAADAICVFGDIHTTADLGHSADVDHHIQRAYDAHRRLVDDTNACDLESIGQWPAYQAMQIDGHRLVEELAATAHELCQIGDRAPTGRSSR